MGRVTLRESKGLDTATRVKKLQDACTFTFINLTDIHMTLANEFKQKEAIYHALHISSLFDTNCLTMSGDIYDGRAIAGSTKKRGLAVIQDMINTVQSTAKIPVLIGKGNHDDNLWDGSYDQDEYGILNNDWHRYCVQPFKKRFVLDHKNKEGNYFYIDFPASKIRIVMLNSVDVPYQKNTDGTPKHWGMWEHAFQNKQINWLAHQALHLDEAGWGVIILAHHPIRKEMKAANREEAVPFNAKTIEGIMKAFKEKTYFESNSTGTYAHHVTVDYSQANGELICYINGHEHYDDVKALDGITYINQLNSKAQNNNRAAHTPARILGTDSEEAFDVYTIDRKRKKIYATRHGAGKDREMDY